MDGKVREEGERREGGPTHLRPEEVYSLRPYL